MILFEDERDIEQLILFIGNKIKELRHAGKLDAEILEQLMKIHQSTIIPWSDEYYLYNRKISKEKEDEIIDELLRMVNILKYL